MIKLKSCCLKPAAVLAALLLALAFPAEAAEECTLRLRPAINEFAFAAPGAPLSTADRICSKRTLIIPYDQKAGLVSIKQGSYPLKKEQGQALSFYPFSRDGLAKIASCPLCDPLEEVVVVRQTALCVKSKLDVLSCATEGAVSFIFGDEMETQENVCVPTVYYYGREGEILHFAAEDCQGGRGAIVSYDLKAGSILRFRDLRFEVLGATNLGIYYKRL